MDEAKNPEEETKERIRHLGLVGTTLRQGFSSENQDFGTNFFYAKEALQKFSEGIAKLNLDPRSQKGMDDLVAYLWEKLDKRERGISK